VLRTEPAEVVVPINIAAPGFCMRLRQDGGYTLSAGLGVVADIVPDGLRYLSEYLPLIRDRASYGTTMRFGARFIKELCYEFLGGKVYARERVCDPAPHQRDVRDAPENARRAIPALGQLKTSHAWGGLFDVMPDALPVISAVTEVPGLVVSTGYSGHGFGLGPGAGEATAKLVLSQESGLSAFRFDRFSRRGHADVPAS
jgi:glycine/D-amino acid oxidase-like deaminating enzyme